MPQGSVLDPLLFLLYINDLCNVSKALDFILFADDTNIFFSHNDPNQLMEIVNNELKKLSSWFQANKLFITCELGSSKGAFTIAFFAAVNHNYAYLQATNREK